MSFCLLTPFPKEKAQGKEYKSVGPLFLFFEIIVFLLVKGKLNLN